VGKKVNLPLLDDRDEGAKGEKKKTKKPSIDVARTRLGGRAEANEVAPHGLAPGVIVTFALTSGRRRAAVVVYAGPAEVHVLLDGIRLRRLKASELLPHDGAVDDDLVKLAADARLFGLLVEGQSVRYADDSGQLVDGKLVEKCRWGALVLRDDGAVVAVGFRKLWPAPTTPST
jgi:hypothetical protein